MPFRRTVAALLENASLPSVLTWLPSEVYRRIANQQIARPVHVPAGVSVIGVGGAVLGGAGKTPVVIAYAKALRAAGHRVSVVAHGYRATPEAVRKVDPGDRVIEVGDDALVIARALSNSGVSVWVGPNKDQTLRQAARESDTLVVDGLLQTRPSRLSRSFLVLDALQPWGSGRCVPAGDLRADPMRLLQETDQVVLVYDPAVGEPKDLRASWPEAIHARLEISAFSSDAGTLTLQQGSQARLGVLLLVARPSRVLASLRARKVPWICSWQGADHCAPGPWDRAHLARLARKHRLDAWLVTPKCRTHLSSDLGAPIWTVETCVRLDPQP